MGSSSEKSNNYDEKGLVTSDNNRPRTLREIELEVLEEGRQWTRQRLEQKLQAEADRQGGVFPPQQPRSSASAQARYDHEKRRRRGKA